MNLLLVIYSKGAVDSSRREVTFLPLRGEWFKTGGSSEALSHCLRSTKWAGHRLSHIGSTTQSASRSCPVIELALGCPTLNCATQQLWLSCQRSFTFVLFAQFVAEAFASIEPLFAGARPVRRDYTGGQITTIWSHYLVVECDIEQHYRSKH